MDAFGVRRVETRIDGSGAAVIASDGPPPRTVSSPHGFGVAELLWLDGPVRSVDDGRDRPTTDGWDLEPPAGGASARVIRMPPPAPGTPVDEQWLRVAGDDPARPGMHATDTLDLMVVLDGAIVLGLDDGEHRLAAGDAVVQRGTAHRWRVDGDRPCTYAVVMLRPRPDAPDALDLTARAGDPGPGAPRRLVTGTGGDGRSHVVLDGAPATVLRSPGAHGVVLSDLWQTGGPLARPAQGGDGEGPWTLEPLGGGVSFRTVELAAGHDPGEAGWHATATIDLDIVLAGRLELALPGVDPVELGPGDVVVQRGTEHRWRPLGDQPVRWAAVMLAVG